MKGCEANYQEYGERPDLLKELISLKKEIKHLKSSKEDLKNPDDSLLTLKNRIQSILNTEAIFADCFPQDPNESLNNISEFYENFFEDLEILNKKDLKEIGSFSPKKTTLNPHTYGQEDIPLENIQENLNHPNTTPKFPDLPSLLLPKILSNTRVNSTDKQIERVNILLDSLKEVLDWRYGNLVKSGQSHSPSSKKVAELHQSIQCFQSYLNGMDKGAIKRTYLNECKDIAKQIKKVFTNNLKPEEKSHTHEFFSKTIKELNRLDAKFKSL